MKTAVMLKSKSGCLTCLTRKKKCDEISPRCGPCERLGLTCIKRGRQTDGASKISATNSRSKALPLRVTISNGWPPFRSDLEKHMCQEGPQILRHHISRMADPGFRNVVVFGRFSTCDTLVRQALVAFSAYGQVNEQSELSHHRSLSSYTKCLTLLRRDRAYESPEPVERDMALTAILFLALLEGLKLGDPGNAVTHFEMCRRLLVARLSQPAVLEDEELVKVYQIAAECIIYNFATLSPFHPQIGLTVPNWGHSFDCLFSQDSYSSSPFFGGFREIYHVMFRTNVLLHHVQGRALTLSPDTTVLREFDDLWQELARLESRIPDLYSGQYESSATTELYRAKYKIHVLSLRIHLIKVCRDNVKTDDPSIQHYLRECIHILQSQDVLEPGNPALRWPFTILACSACADDDFTFICDLMQRTARIVDPANSRKLIAASMVIEGFRKEPRKPVRVSRNVVILPESQIDFLLDPGALDDHGGLSAV